MRAPTRDLESLSVANFVISWRLLCAREKPVSDRKCNRFRQQLKMITRVAISVARPLRKAITHADGRIQAHGITTSSSGSGGKSDVKVF